MVHTNTALKIEEQEKEVETSPLNQLTSYTSTDMKTVNDTIMSQMQSDVPLIPQLAGYLIASGGKRIRPLLTLATTRLIDTDIDKSAVLATAVEFIHTATLLHDDVVDESTERRGKKAANLIFGNQEAVLVGDFLFSKAFQLMVKANSIEILRILSEASAIIAEGEVLQLQHQRDISISMDTYKEIIKSKTAALFAASCEVSGAIAENEQVQIALRDYGYNLGMTFQITDDTLDYDADQKALGKTLGDDFREGKITAPVLYAIETASDEEKAFWQRTIVDGDTKDGDFGNALSLIKNHDALEKSKDLARYYADKAQDSISKIEAISSVNSDILSILKSIPTYIIQRDK